MSNRKQRRRDGARRAAAHRKSRELPVVKRQCGTCEACCYGLKIVAPGERPHDLEAKLMSDEFEYCEHQLSRREDSDCNGCAIYRSRPDPCVKFRCEWLRGVNFPGLSEADSRPDRLGIILYTLPKTRVGEVVAASEAFEGGSDTPNAQRVLAAIASKYPLIVFKRGKRRAMGPSWFVTRFEAIAAGCGLEPEE